MPGRQALRACLKLPLKRRVDQTSAGSGSSINLNDLRSSVETPQGLQCTLRHECCASYNQSQTPGLQVALTRNTATWIRKTCHRRYSLAFACRLQRSKSVSILISESGCSGCPTVCGLQNTLPCQGCVHSSCCAERRTPLGNSSLSASKTTMDTPKVLTERC